MFTSTRGLMVWVLERHPEPLVQLLPMDVANSVCMGISELQPIGEPFFVFSSRC